MRRELLLYFFSNSLGASSLKEFAVISLQVIDDNSEALTVKNDVVCLNEHKQLIGKVNESNL
jgi:hypothetical protein